MPNTSLVLGCLRPPDCVCHAERNRQCTRMLIFRVVDIIMQGISEDVRYIVVY